jgi:hypothetical protein
MCQIGFLSTTCPQATHVCAGLFQDHDPIGGNALAIVTETTKQTRCRWHRTPKKTQQPGSFLNFLRFPANLLQRCPKNRETYLFIRTINNHSFR